MIQNIIKVFLTCGLVFYAGVAYCVSYQTYVVHTYGDPNLVDVIQNELNGLDGGMVTMYQDKLIVKATPQDYQKISHLISQIDTAPLPLTISLTTHQSDIYRNQGGYAGVQFGGISRGVWLNGVYHDTHEQTHTGSYYQAKTLSGSPVQIGTSVLLGLVKPSIYRQNDRFWINWGTSWIALKDGFGATATILPNSKIRLTVQQSAYGASMNVQNLDTSIIIDKGVWTMLGQIAINKQNFDENQVSAFDSVSPIWVRVD